MYTGLHRAAATRAEWQKCSKALSLSSRIDVAWDISEPTAVGRIPLSLATRVFTAVLVVLQSIITSIHAAVVPGSILSVEKICYSSICIAVALMNTVLQ